LRCVAGYLEPKEVGGRRPSAPVAGAEFTLRVEAVLCAIGQRPDGDLFAAEGLEVRENGAIVADEATCATSLEGVFAAGDVAGRPGSVVEAIADGRRAAAAICRYLAGEPLEPPAPSPEPRPLDRKTLLARHIEKPDEARVVVAERDPSARVRDFAEVELTLDEAEARREAARCLACGCGVGCGLCRKVCIYDAVGAEGASFAIDPEKCDGCGLCAVRCPNQAIVLEPTEG